MGSCIRLLGLVFWNLIHLEVASNPFCLLWNCPWLLVFALCLFFMILSGFNLYCWNGIHFSWNNFLIFLLHFLGLIFTFHFWFRDLLRELDKKYEVLLIILMVDEVKSCAQQKCRIHNLINFYLHFLCLWRN